MNPYQPPYPQQPGYGPPGHPPPGYPPPGYGPPGYAGPAPFSIEGIVSASKPAIALLGLRAALPILLRMIGAISPMPGAGPAIDGIKSLLGFAALIAYFVWFARAYAWVRAVRGGADYSTGLAIGGWFIPFVNFVMPWLAMRDLWKRAVGPQNGWLVGLWWVAYLVNMVITIFYSLLQAQPSLGSGLGSSRAIWDLVGWTGTLSQLGGYGLLAYLIMSVTNRASGKP